VGICLRKKSVRDATKVPQTYDDELDDNYDVSEGWIDNKLWREPICTLEKFVHAHYIRNVNVDEGFMSFIFMVNSHTKHKLNP
jgi:hypothetical protein